MNNERTLSEQWAHAEQNMVGSYILWTMKERREQTQRKRTHKVNGERTVNDMWTLWERKMDDT